MCQSYECFVFVFFSFPKRSCAFSWSVQSPEPANEINPTKMPKWTNKPERKRRRQLIPLRNYGLPIADTQQLGGRDRKKKKPRTNKDGISLLWLLLLSSVNIYYTLSLSAITLFVTLCALYSLEQKMPKLLQHKYIWERKKQGSKSSAINIQKRK